MVTSQIWDVTIKMRFLSIIFWPKRPAFFNKNFFFVFFKQTKQTNKQKISITYLPNIAPSELKYPKLEFLLDPELRGRSTGSTVCPPFKKAS